jgi:Putative peptidoglycan binding domain
MGGVHEARPRNRRSPSAGTVEARPNEQPVDDWLGDVSDDDWDENAAARSEPRRSTPPYEDPYRDDSWPEPAAGAVGADDPDRPADARRATVERRRIVAGGVAVAVLGIAAAALVVLLRDGGSEPSSATTPAVTTPGSTDTTTSPSTTPTPPPPPSATTPTTPSTDEASSFTLPDGTKLRRGEENDAAVVTELQQALTSAGYDPGAADGVYGQGTEAAVVAFQEDNGLTADGVVGPDTATALNNALAGG